jgi:hypothetical protein
VAFASVPPGVATAREPVTYRAPVEAPITDHFRPPATPYGPGNRGVDYGTRTGGAVHAAAAGEVVFAGAVGNSLHVVVLHADGIRTSYSFLRTVSVARGNRVDAGATVGTSATSLHFGARAGDAYLDPEVLLAGAARVHLIEDGVAANAASPQSESAERSGLVRLVWGGVSAAGRVGGSGAARLASASVDVVADLPPLDQVRAAIAGIDRLRTDGLHRPGLPGEATIRDALRAASKLAGREPCTPAEAPTPKPDPSRDRHRLVLVGGLGSSSGHAAVLDVDPASLGYRVEDVVQFSYRGGDAARHPYAPEDTLADLRQSGRRLRELLEQLQYDEPGVTVDVIAHSQGGLVARSAFGDELDPFDPRAPRVGTVITLATPHHGADAATAAALMRHTKNGPVGEWGVGTVGRRRGLDPRSKSIHQMAETSDYLRALNRRALPKGVRAVSIAARRDVVVPSPRSRLRGARNVIVTVPGLNDHGNLPGSVAAHREMALALAGRPPTCETAADMAADMLAGRAIDTAETAGGVAAAAASEGT